MNWLKTGALAGLLLVGLGGVARAGLATGDNYDFTVWSGTYSGLGINGQADYANAPAGTPTATFSYTGPLNFVNQSPQGSTNSAADFFGANATGISNYVDTSTQFNGLSAFLQNDVLSTVGTSGDARVTFMEITGTYIASVPTRVTVTHDDGASLNIDLPANGRSTTLISSPGFTGQRTDVATLPVTGTSGSNFMLFYVEANGSPSILQVDPPRQVPEPGSLVLLGTGLIGLGLVLRRRPS